ncbi:hypothetical protein ACFPPE_01675 [Agromyces tardus]|jgi:amino acid permease|nr:hypothetical protein [Agromyces tardus]
MSEPTRPWWTDDGTGGIGFARMFAWTGLFLAVGALVLAIAAPLQGDALRTVWITGFGAISMWVAYLAVPRYRGAGVPVSWTVPLTMVLGGLAILIMFYAFAVIVAAANGVALPAPAHWLAPTDPAGVTA